MKECAACGLYKPSEQFSKNKTLSSGLNSSCKECIKKRSRHQYLKHKEKRLADKAKYREKNRERLRLEAVEYRQRAWDINKRWRTANREKIRLTSQRRRARIKASMIGKVTSRDIIRMLSKPCVYCGSKSQHIDHVIPLSRGGSHSLGNLAPACPECNHRKSTKLVIEWKASKR